jgi:ATP-dependent Lon protease
VLLPARNRKDLHDVPESARAALRFGWLETVQDAMHAGFASGRALQPRPPFDLK